VGIPMFAGGSKGCAHTTRARPHYAFQEATRALRIQSASECWPAHWWTGLLSGCLSLPFNFQGCCRCPRVLWPQAPEDHPRARQRVGFAGRIPSYTVGICCLLLMPAYPDATFVQPDRSWGKLLVAVPYSRFFLLLLQAL